MKKRNQRGSVTIEATIALTAFLFMFMMLYSVITICRAEAKIGVAVNNAAKELSQYSYVYSLTGLNESEAAINASAQGTEDDINGAVGNIAETFDAMQTLRTDGKQTIDSVSSAEEEIENAINIDYDSLDNIITQLNNTTAELTAGAEQLSTDVDAVYTSVKEVQTSLEAMADNPKELMFGIAKIFAVKGMDLAKTLIAAPVSRALVKKNLKRSPSDNANDCLKALGVVAGKDFSGNESYLHGLDFSHSLLYPEGKEDIIIIVKYKLKLFKYLPIDIEFDITQVAATKGWFKGDGKRVDKVPNTVVADEAADPGVTPITPGEVPTIPGVIPIIPGEVPTIPGVIPTTPGVTPTVPGIIPAIPGVITTTPEEIPTPVIEGATEAIERAIAMGTLKTWNEFLAANSGKSVEEASSSYIKLIEGQSPWPENFVPQQKVLKPGDTFQMALDSTQPVTSPGNFATFDNISNVDYVRNNLAVKSDWKVNCSKVVTYRVKQGVELPVLEGPVGPQIDINADKYLSGGGTQIQMLLDRSINKMDYLEVVSVRSIN